MEIKKVSPQVQRSEPLDEPAGPSLCPVCGSPTVPLRGLVRCSLCCFVLCEGCEGGGFGPGGSD